MIPQSTIDRIVDAANIVDVVSDYVTTSRFAAQAQATRDCVLSTTIKPPLFLSLLRVECASASVAARVATLSTSSWRWNR